MALEVSFVLSWVFLCLAAVIPTTIFFKLKKSNYLKRKGSKQLPPGEMGLPWIGETMDFYKAQRKNQLFEDFLEPRVKKYGKIFKTHLMGSPTIIVNGAEANHFILSNEFKLVISSWPSSSIQLMGKDSIMTKQGDKHHCIRKLVTTSLNYRGLEALVPGMCNTVQLHLETKWQGKGEISLYSSTKALTFIIVFECLLGIEAEPGMLETFEKVLEGVFAPPVKFPGSKFSKAKKARQEIQSMLVKVVREKRKEIEENGSVEEEDEERTVLWRLVRGLIKGEISEEEVVDNVVLLVFAAHDTTSFAIVMMFKMLAKHPSCYDLLLQEHVHIMSNKREGGTLKMEDMKKMKYTWQVAQETMRLFPPIFGSFREAVVDIEYQEFTIPRGWKVLWTAYGTHFSSEYFEEPMSFNPSRFEEAIQPYTLLPFGGGPRLCAGFQLAKMNILIFLHFVVTRYNWSLLYPDEPISIDPLPFPSHGMPISISPKVI